MGFVLLFQQYGVARTLVGLAALKCVKLTLVCWRSTSLNSQVRRLCQERLADTEEQGKDRKGDNSDEELDVQEECPVPEAAAAKQRHSAGLCSAGDGLCAVCNCPLWLRRSTEEQNIQLDACGCVMHLDCLLDAARQQHGISMLHRLPRSFDELDETFSQVFNVVSRFVGISAISVDSLCCPGCNLPNSSWRLVDSRCAPVLEAATPSKFPLYSSLLSPFQCEASPQTALATVAALRQGDALCISALRDTILLASRTIARDRAPQKLLSLGWAPVDSVALHNDVAQHLLPWSKAAGSEDGLRQQLQHAGPGVSRDLSKLLERCLGQLAEIQDAELQIEDAALPHCADFRHRNVPGKRGPRIVLHRREDNATEYSAMSRVEVSDFLWG
eukprot:TRINITY_DN50581_c0_g1_i1.p1 TRINITY_DN50581_c0_g1~~TRINITY_DN50581_c0_g1_i1.p1  ORF type:complete len:387 (-),score=91.75 TRINITY_DN50581_c0_g1_i1:12-1172(-)